MHDISCAGPIVDSNAGKPLLPRRFGRLEPVEQVVELLEQTDQLTVGGGIVAY